MRELQRKRQKLQLIIRIVFKKKTQRFKFETALNFAFNSGFFIGSYPDPRPCSSPHAKLRHHYYRDCESIKLTVNTVRSVMLTDHAEGDLKINGILKCYRART